MTSPPAKLPLVHVWTDGSGTTTQKPGGWAYVMRYEAPNGHVSEREGFGGAVSATNNRMELSGPLHALRALNRPCRVVIHSDSEYVVKAFREQWIERWRRKRWRAVKNADLWLQLVRETQRHDVTFEWVRGHAGHVENERCDYLAGRTRREIIAALEAGTAHELEFTVDGVPDPNEQLALT